MQYNWLGLPWTVGTILGLLASKPRDRILQAYPYAYVEAEDLDAALACAAWRLEEREEPLVVASALLRQPSVNESMSYESLVALLEVLLEGR